MKISKEGLVVIKKDDEQWAIREGVPKITLSASFRLRLVFRDYYCSETHEIEFCGSAHTGQMRMVGLWTIRGSYLRHLLILGLRNHLHRRFDVDAD